jgi:hypothetical protein
VSVVEPQDRLLRRVDDRRTTRLLHLQSPRAVAERIASFFARA